MIGRHIEFFARAACGVDIAAHAITIEINRRTQSTFFDNASASDLVQLNNASIITNTNYGSVGGQLSYTEDALEIEGTVAVTTTGLPSGSVDIFMRISPSGTVWSGDTTSRSVLSIGIAAAGTTSPQRFKLT